MVVNMYDGLLRALVSYMRHGDQRRDTFDSKYSGLFKLV